MRCTICNNELRHGPDTFQRVTGWVSTRGAKGFKTERKEQEFAHKHCLEAQSHRNQGSLFAA